MKTLSGIELIVIERKRQIVKEGWTSSHDATHGAEELASAAACYALPKHQWPRFQQYHHGFPRGKTTTFLDHVWPWARKWWKPTPCNRIKELAKAGALIAAEIDRIQRLKISKP